MLKKTSLKAAMVAAILAFAVPAFGQDNSVSISSFLPGIDWLLVTESNQGDTYFIHPSSIVRDGNGVEAWVIMHFAEPQSDKNGKTYRSTRSLNRYDCKKRTMQIKHRSEYSEYGAQGEVVSLWEEENTKPSHVAPDTVGYSMMNAACKKPRT